MISGDSWTGNSFRRAMGGAVGIFHGFLLDDLQIRGFRLAQMVGDHWADPCQDMLEELYL